MTELSQRDFERLCRSGPIESELSRLDHRRRTALWIFWLSLIAGTLLVGATMWLLVASGRELLALIGAPVWLILCLIAIFQTVLWGESIKAATLQTLASHAGLLYSPRGFDPPGFLEARGVVFGGRLTVQAFSDMFQGQDDEGKRIAFYEAFLTRQEGQTAVTVFKGQVYVFERRTKGKGIVAVLPKKLPLKLNIPAALERVQLDGDLEFRDAFDVLSAKPDEASRKISGEVRRLLLELARSGPAFVYVGVDNVLVAVTGSNRFEAGSMFRSNPGEERVQNMFGDVCFCLNTLGRLMRVLA